jgi:hypothetical protein
VLPIYHMTTGIPSKQQLLGGHDVVLASRLIGRPGISLCQVHEMLTCGRERRADMQRLSCCLREKVG